MASRSERVELAGFDEQPDDVRMDPPKSKDDTGSFTLIRDDERVEYPIHCEHRHINKYVIIEAIHRTKDMEIYTEEYSETIYLGRDQVSDDEVLHQITKLQHPDRPAPGRKKYTPTSIDGVEVYRSIDDKIEGERIERLRVKIRSDVMDGWDSVGIVKTVDEIKRSRHGDNRETGGVLIALKKDSDAEA